MDNIDSEILKNLKINGRMSHEELGRRLNISRTAIHQRVGKLQAEMIIKGYTALINWEKLGQNVKAFVNIKVAPSNFQETIKNIVQIEVPNVTIEDCYRLSGEWCISLKVRACTPKDISNLIDAFIKINGITETSTTFSLSTIMENGVVVE